MAHPDDRTPSLQDFAIIYLMFNHFCGIGKIDTLKKKRTKNII